MKAGTVYVASGRSDYSNCGGLVTPLWESVARNQPFQPRLVQSRPSGLRVMAGPAEDELLLAQQKKDIVG
jgi:hypothetical protein